MTTGKNCWKANVIKRNVTAKWRQGLQNLFVSILFVVKWTWCSKQTWQHDFGTSPMGLISLRSTRVITSKWSLIYVRNEWKENNSQGHQVEKWTFNAFHLGLLRRLPLLLSLYKASYGKNVDDCENYYSNLRSSCFSCQFYVMPRNDEKHLGRSLSFIAAKVHHSHDVFSLHRHSHKWKDVKACSLWWRSTGSSSISRENFYDAIS